MGGQLVLEPKQHTLQTGERLCILSDGVTELKTDDHRKPLRLQSLLQQVATAPTALQALETLNAYVDERPRGPLRWRTTSPPSSLERTGQPV